MKMGKFTEGSKVTGCGLAGWPVVSSLRVKFLSLLHSVFNIRYSLLVLCLLFIALCSSAQQDSSYTLIRSTKTNARNFATDKLQQSYLVSPKNEVIKYDAQGREVFQYNNNYLGDLQLIDATNPFNLLLYYPDYQTVITLDRTLNKTGEINLFELGIINVQAIASSNDNNVWIYDDATFKLKKIDQNGQVLVESDDLSLLLNKAPKPIQIKARENWVYVNDPEMGILVFDNFAQYHKLLAFEKVNFFQIIGNQLIYAQAGKLYNFHLQSLLTSPVVLPTQVDTSQFISFQKNHLYVLRNGNLEIYYFK